MKDKIGKKVVRLVNRHWLLFAVISCSPWGFPLGLWMGFSAINQRWVSFVIALIISLIWIVAVFMQGYTDKENRHHY